MARGRWPATAQESYSGELPATELWGNSDEDYATALDFFDATSRDLSPQLLASPWYDIAPPQRPPPVDASIREAIQARSDMDDELMYSTADAFGQAKTMTQNWHDRLLSGTEERIDRTRTVDLAAVERRATKQAAQNALAAKRLQRREADVSAVEERAKQTMAELAAQSLRSKRKEVELQQREELAVAREQAVRRNSTEALESFAAASAKERLLNKRLYLREELLQQQEREIQAREKESLMEVAKMREEGRLELEKKRDEVEKEFTAQSSLSPSMLAKKDQMLDRQLGKENQLQKQYTEKEEQLDKRLLEKEKEFVKQLSAKEALLLKDMAEKEKEMGKQLLERDKQSLKHMTEKERLSDKEPLEKELQLNKKYAEKECELHKQWAEKEKQLEKRLQKEQDAIRQREHQQLEREMESKADLMRKKEELSIECTRLAVREGPHLQFVEQSAKAEQLDILLEHAHYAIRQQERKQFEGEKAFQSELARAKEEIRLEFAMRQSDLARVKEGEHLGLAKGIMDADQALAAHSLHSLAAFSEKEQMLDRQLEIVREAIRAQKREQSGREAEHRAQLVQMREEARIEIRKRQDEADRVLVDLCEGLGEPGAYLQKAMADLSARQAEFDREKASHEAFILAVEERDAHLADREQKFAEFEADTGIYQQQVYVERDINSVQDRILKADRDQVARLMNGHRGRVDLLIVLLKRLAQKEDSSLVRSVCRCWRAVTVQALAYSKLSQAGVRLQAVAKPEDSEESAGDHIEDNAADSVEASMRRTVDNVLRKPKVWIEPMPSAVGRRASDIRRRKDKIADIVRKQRELSKTSMFFVWRSEWLKHHSRKAEELRRYAEKEALVSGKSPRTLAWEVKGFPMSKWERVEDRRKKVPLFRDGDKQTLHTVFFMWKHLVRDPREPPRSRNAKQQAKRGPEEQDPCKPVAWSISTTNWASLKDQRDAVAKSPRRTTPKLKVVQVKEYKDTEVRTLKGLDAFCRAP